MLEPEYIRIAQLMLGKNKLPKSLMNRLAYAEKLVKKVKPNGSLCSTQVISSIIIQWAESEPT